MSSNSVSQFKSKTSQRKNNPFYCEDLQQSNDAFKYMVYNGKYNNSKNCSADFGLVGGNNVSQYCGNLVDLETDLRISSNSINNMFLDPESDKKKLINLPSCSDRKNLGNIGYGNENIIQSSKNCNQ